MGLIRLGQGFIDDGSPILDSGDITHNLTVGLQGGNGSDEYYHLDATEFAFLDGIDQSVNTDSDVTHNIMTLTGDLLFASGKGISDADGDTKVTLGESDDDILRMFVGDGGEMVTLSNFPSGIGPISRMTLQNADSTQLLMTAGAARNTNLILNRGSTGGDVTLEFHTADALKACIGLDNSPAVFQDMLTIKDGDSVATAVLVADPDNSRIGINATTAPTEALDVTGNIAVSGTVDGRDISVDGIKLDSLSAQLPVTDIFAPILNQTVFTLTQTVSDVNSFSLVLNHSTHLVNTVDYTISGTTLTWLDPDGLTLDAGDQLVARYNTSIIAPTLRFHESMATDYSANDGNFRVRQIGANGSHRFSFSIPEDFNNAVSLELIGQPESGADGAGKDIDIFSEYGVLGEAFDTNVESDTTTLYDLTGTFGQTIAVIDLFPIVSNIAAGQEIGFLIDHKGIGGAIDYLRIKLAYT